MGVLRRDLEVLRGGERTAAVVDLCDRGEEASETDGRYRALVGDEAWASLPAAVRRRFSTALSPGELKLYAGRVTQCRLSMLGRIIAALTRFVGGPLPLVTSPGLAVVSVTENPELGGQVWTRTYARSGGFPQVISSAKCFGGPTGLDERLGAGIVMRLAVSVDGRDLVFTSAGYAIEVAGRALPLPRWLEPGRCEVRHRDEGAGRFQFILTLDHRWLGRLVHQVATFQDVHAGHGVC